MSLHYLVKHKYPRKPETWNKYLALQIGCKFIQISATTNLQNTIIRFDCFESFWYQKHVNLHQFLPRDAMLCDSAKRSLAIACWPSLCLFICLSVCLLLVDCDHIGWKSWKLIAARTISPLLFVAQRPSIYIHRGIWEILERLKLLQRRPCWARL